MDALLAELGLHVKQNLQRFTDPYARTIFPTQDGYSLCADHTDLELITVMFIFMNIIMYMKIKGKNYHGFPHLYSKKIFLRTTETEDEERSFGHFGNVKLYIYASSCLKCHCILRGQIPHGEPASPAPVCQAPVSHFRSEVGKPKLVDAKYHDIMPCWNQQRCLVWVPACCALPDGCQKVTFTSQSSLDHLS